MDGLELPAMRGPVPGPRARAAIDILATHECPAIIQRRARRAAALGTASDDPIVWDRAVGANVWDVDGNRYVDLTSGFGVALVGHRHPAVVAAVERQLGRLIHAMGDAWPDASRIELLGRLAAFAPPELSVAILGLSGSDAVDAAIKTARLATDRRGILVFEGAYHGLALGVLGLQSARPAFSEPFADVTHPAITKLPWGCPPDVVAAVLAEGTIGLVLVEPIQGRGGIRPAPPGWLARLAQLTRASGALFALDEIQTGMGRTGVPLAGGSEGVVPDLVCVGKALAGGFPLSACLGTPRAMEAWGASTGEAIHTQTFLGHPIGCAAALAVLDLLEGGLLEQVQERAGALEAHLGPLRGRGLMRALELGEGIDALAASRALLQRGFLVLPAGPTSLQIVPPVCLTDPQLGALAQALREIP
ncbi:MAG TPA: aspartate aminotransferase family protein [Deltaproteobacteria bacterium]|nr:aspartate aminotransferase family protein [Deltaproteobacteria bacterium]